MIRQITPNSKVDLKLVEMVIGAIQQGDDSYPELKQFEAEFRDLRDQLQSHEDHSRLDTLLRANPAAGAEAAEALIRETLEFAEQQIDRFQQIKSQRPLTEEEQRFGKNCLLPLVGGPSELISQT